MSGCIGRRGPRSSKPARVVEVTISGPQGAGKSVLARWIASRLEGRAKSVDLFGEDDLFPASEVDAPSYEEQIAALKHTRIRIRTEHTP